MFVRSPGFFAGVLLTLALGIGANTAVFSLVKAVVLQPLPYERPGELVMLWRSSLAATQLQRSQATPRFVVGWRDRAADVMTIAAVNANLEGHMDFQTADGAERLPGGVATPNFFEVLGARPLLGRLFTTEDEAAGATDLVVLSHDVWQQTFHSDPAIVGRSITLTSGRSTQAAAPVHRDWRADAWLPLQVSGAREDLGDAAMEPRSPARRSMSSVISSLAGCGLPCQLPRPSQRLAALHDEIRPSPAFVPPGDRQTTRLERMDDWVLGDSRRTMALLASVAATLLVIACVTVANALVIRIGERRHELALRTAIGATRARLLRQLLVEGAVLAAAGTAAGVVLAVTLAARRCGR